MRRTLHNDDRTRDRRMRPPAAAVALLAAMACAAGPADPDVIRVRTVDRATFPAQLISFSIEDGLRMQSADDGPSSVPVKDIVSIERAGAQPEMTAELRYELADGSALCGELIGGDEERLLVRHRWLGDVSLPIEALLVIRRSAATGDEPGRAISGDADRIDDVITLENGDRIVGTLIEVREKTLVVDTERGERAVPINVVHEARLANPPGPRVPAQPRARLSLTDGSRLVTDRLTWQDGLVDVTLRGEQASIPERVVQRVDVVGGRWVWMSDLTPADVSVTPLWSAAFPPRNDRNVVGERMRVNGRRFDRGVGVHSTCKLRYDLNRRFAWFVVQPGLDDAAGRLADVAARIVADGNTIFETNYNAKQRCEPDERRFDVSDVKTLELIVDFGNYGDVQDRFDWADAALIRPE